LKLIDHDYVILRKFQGRSSIHTYLNVVIQRMFLDYRISAWGKWRPSNEAKRAGPLGVLLEQLLVRDGRSFDEACELLRINCGLSTTRVDLEQLAERLPRRTRHRFESDESLKEMRSGDVSADDLVARHEQGPTATRTAQILKNLLAELETQDRLILAMRFEDGRAVAEIAATLHIGQKSLYRRIETLLKHLRWRLQAQGVEPSEVMEMLQGRDVNEDWPT
jgi:RNA polymerase sigma factor for flagellar operon FliA